MQYSEIDGTGIRVSRVGFGCWQLGGHGWGLVSEAEMVRAVDGALDKGINIFDTAPIYGLGHSEELLGKVLGTRRQDVVIATKAGLHWENGGAFSKRTDSSPASIEKEIDASLRRLQMDYVDIYQIHWPDPDTDAEDTMAAMEKLRKSGKIRVIGCCNFPLDLLKQALRFGDIKTVQVARSLIDREADDELIPFCQENGIGVLTYSSIGKGLLTGKYDARVRFDPDDNRSRHPYFQEEALRENLRIVEKVKTVARRLSKTPGQVALAWLLANPAVSTALVGTKNAAQLAENAAASDLALSEADREFLAGREQGGTGILGGETVG